MTIGIFLKRLATEIILVGISDSRIKIKCDGYYMDIGLLDDERYWVMTKYKIDVDMPRLPETEVSKILNKN